ncbi:Thiamine pyrophosphate enzyme C-terminal TPP-binding [Penicillium cinerascens]|uniref:Thiamine pyrophosphate enzyme C-terminal TPP-binding n=1 Tax=Penicillium cinerascens TaxID=70096 RepID=A0A9W9NF46_9EURO|nr:Thiamine pyrophosphate enzyme C-terminal TPP-binding [Penicillium cinerascens]KAJ5218755.1 Thiamine pyrophosphate enzyme C-terminal TPP-binding [Penicillium cinerascens]
MTRKNGERSAKRARYEDEVTKNGELTSAAEAFFEALAEAGVTHCFVNLGSDHPAMLEAMVKAKQGKLDKFPNIITCPSELVALSAALGYAQVTGIPTVVPWLWANRYTTLLLAECPFYALPALVPSLKEESFWDREPSTKTNIGAKTSTDNGRFIHWLQDVPDQAAILRQYCRYSGEVKSGRNIKQLVNRALELTMSDPKGPAYLMAAREVLEEKVERKWLEEELLSPMAPSALPEPEVELIAKALMSAKRPLVITGYLGRNLQAPALLEELGDKLPISVVEMVGSDVCIRSDHEAYRGVTVTTHPDVLEADVILVMDCDVPWIPTAGEPKKGTKIFHLDVDPLKQQMPLFSIKAIRRLKVNCGIALKQLNTYLDSQNVDKSHYTSEFDARTARHASWRQSLQSLESPPDGDIVTVPYLTSRLRQFVPENTTFVLEAVTNAGHLIHHLNLTKPGTLFGSGAGGLGWGGGAALGVKLAKPDSFICAIVGDGTYLFSQMESVYWIARRYDIPFLLVVLNNGGWNAPKVSALLVHKDGLSSKANRRDLNISFEPSPDYPGIARAAGSAWGATVMQQSEVDSTIKEATRVVQGGRCAVIEVAVPSIWKEV